MIAHTILPVSDYEKSTAFYVQALPPPGEKCELEEAGTHNCITCGGITRLKSSDRSYRLIINKINLNSGRRMEPLPSLSIGMTMGQRANNGQWCPVA